MTTASLATLAFLAAASPSPDYPFALSYHPDARRARAPGEPLWSGEPPCERPASAPDGHESHGTAPKALRNSPPDLSKLTRRTRAFAPFLAEVSISAEGRVSAVRVLRSNSAEFDAAVLRQLASQVYEPARLDGRAVATCMVYTARPHP